MMEGLRFSRARATATLLGCDSDKHLFNRPVLLTGTIEALCTKNGEEMAVAALLLLMKTTNSLTIALPVGCEGIAEIMRQWAAKHAWDELPTIKDEAVDPSEFAAVLSIGGPPRPALPWTVITCDGWLVRVTSSATPIAQECLQPNPIAAVAAASLGVGEVFKHLMRLPADKGLLLDGLIFSLWTYDSGDQKRGPALPERLDVDLLVAGAGAIGNGVAHLLERLGVRGKVLVLDAQTYGEENWGTCLRLTRAGVSISKSLFLANMLSSQQLTVGPIVARIENLGANRRVPKIVLGGFDNVEARHAVQDLWPDLIIDGAIGPKLECQVSAHPWEGNIGCLRCVFDLPKGVSARDVQQEISGLSADSLNDLTQPLTEKHIETADPERRPWLRQRVGKPICSVLEDAQGLAGEAITAGFRPSVPFVATLSASMMVAEMVRYLITGRVAVEPRFSCSVLWGPERGEFYPEDRHADCICVKRAHNIRLVRKSRDAA